MHLALASIASPLLSMTGGAAVRYVQSRAGRRVAILLLRQELVQNDLVLRRALLKGIRGGQIARGSYDSPQVAPALQHKSLRRVAQAAADVYMRVSSLESDLRRGVRGEAGIRDVNQATVFITRAIRAVDEELTTTYREKPPDAWGGDGGSWQDEDAVFAEIEDPEREEARAAWERFTNHWRADQAYIQWLKPDRRLRLSENPVMSTRFWTEITTQSPDAVAVEIASGIYELRIRDSLRLLMTFEPIPATPLVCLLLDDWTEVWWTPAAAIELAQSRRASAIAAHSGRKRTLIPAQSGQAFRAKADTQSG